MLQGQQQVMSNFWNCICQPAQAKYAIDELLRQVRSPIGAPGPEPLGPSRPVLPRLAPFAPARTHSGAAPRAFLAAPPAFSADASALCVAWAA